MARPWNVHQWQVNSTNVSSELAESNIEVAHVSSELAESNNGLGRLRMFHSAEGIMSSIAF
ncbi:MAG: hypothetical protein ACKO6G_08130, partial [Vulcanococcus sp.]